MISITPIIAPIHAMQGLEIMVGNFMDIPVEFTPELEFRSGTNFVRSSIQMSPTPLPSSHKGVLPCIYYNREPLMANQSMQRRAIIPSGYSDTVDPIMSVVGSIDFNFTFYTNDIIELETFECVYNSMDSVISMSKFTLSLDSDITSEYTIDWGELSSLSVDNLEDATKSVSFSGKLSGMFLYSRTKTTSEQNTNPLILTVNGELFSKGLDGYSTKF